MSYVVTLTEPGFQDFLVVTSDMPDLNTGNNSASLLIGVSDFTLTAASPNLTIQRGQTGTDVLMFEWLGNFLDPVTLSCAVKGPSLSVSCAISPSSVTPGNTATLTINASNLSAGLGSLRDSQKLLFALSIPLMVGCIFLVDKNHRRIGLVCLVVMFAILPSCGGGGGKTSQTYTVAVNAASGTIQHSTTISVTVQ